MRQVGWGVVGCSDIVERRAAAAISAQADSRLVAFYSRDGARAESFARRFGAERHYNDLEALLGDETIDIIYIATEVDRHAPLAIAAAGAGKHVLVEKPMALNTEQCLAMIEAAEDAGVRLSVAYYARFLPKAVAMKQAIDGGRLGRVVRANVNVVAYYNPGTADPKYWRVAGRGGGNMLADVGSHRLDLIAYFLGQPVEVVGFVDRLTMPYEAADSETALLRMAGGTHVTVLANSNVPHSGVQSSLEIYGTEGALLTDPWSPEPVRVLGSDAPAIAAPVPDNSHFPLVDDFAAAIARERAPSFSGVDGMWATAIIDGTYRSARSGRVVRLLGAR